MELKSSLEALVKTYGWATVVATLWDIMYNDPKTINKDVLLEKLTQVLEEV